MNKKNIFILFLVCFCSCKEVSQLENSNTKGLDTHNIAIKDTLILFLGDSVPTLSLAMSYHHSKPTYLSYMPYAQHYLLTYNLDSKKVMKKTPLLEEGVNGLGKGEISTKYINKDTIIVGTGEFMIYLINDEGKIFYKRSLIKDIGNLKSGEANISAKSVPVIHNNKIYVPAIAYVSADKLESFHNMPCLYEIDMVTNNVSAAFNIPTTYYTKGLYGANFAHDFSNTYNPKTKEFVFSFKNDANLYVYSLITKKTNIVHNPSKHFDEIPPMSKGMDVSDNNTGFKFWTKSNSYGSIYYDEFKDVYYRFAEKGVSDELIKEKKLWKLSSLMVLDNKFRKIAEKDMPIVNNLQCFITPDAFYVKHTIPSNENATFIGITTEKREK